MLPRLMFVYHVGLLPDHNLIIDRAVIFTVIFNGNFITQICFSRIVEISCRTQGCPEAERSTQVHACFRALHNRGLPALSLMRSKLDKSWHSDVSKLLCQHCCKVDLQCSTLVQYNVMKTHPSSIHVNCCLQAYLRNSCAVRILV